MDDLSADQCLAVYEAKPGSGNEEVIFYHAKTNQTLCFGGKEHSATSPYYEISALCSVLLGNLLFATSNKPLLS